MPEILHHLAKLLIRVGTVEEDQEENTDLRWIGGERCRVGCRVRSLEYLQFKDEFTIRTWRPSGATTELYKILQGLGDYLAYGFGADNEDKMRKWTIAKLDVFRKWYPEETKRRGVVPGILKKNLDGTAFRVYRWDELPKDFVIGSGDR